MSRRTKWNTTSFGNQSTTARLAYQGSPEAKGAHCELDVVQLYFTSPPPPSFQRKRKERKCLWWSSPEIYKFLCFALRIQCLSLSQLGVCTKCHCNIFATNQAFILPSLSFPHRRLKLSKSLKFYYFILVYVDYWSLVANLTQNSDFQTTQAYSASVGSVEAT